MAACLARAGRLRTPRIFTKLCNGQVPHKLPSMQQTIFPHVLLFRNVSGIPIKMPSLSPTMSEGTIVKWLKQEGETVEPGDIICDIQTDKAVVSFEVEEEGILAKILMGEDSKDISVGKLIALMVQPGEDWKSVEVPSESLESDDSTKPVSTSPQPTPEATKEYSGMRHAGAVPSTVGPAVRTLLELYNVDAAKVTPSGPHGNIVKGDVLAYITANRLSPQAPQAVPGPDGASQPPASTTGPAAPPTPAPQQEASAEGYVDLPLTSMRKTIAKRLTQSKTEIPHAYMQCEARIDRLLSLRKQLKTEGVQASLNDYIIKTVALALRLHPEVNCVWNGEQLERAADVDVAVAVATDAGLITPIVRGAAGRSVAEIGRLVQELAGRARDGKLRPHEFQGGTFTISNLGMFGVDEFSAIINPPQCGPARAGCGRQHGDPADLHAVVRRPGRVRAGCGRLHGDAGGAAVGARSPADQRAPRDPASRLIGRAAGPRSATATRSVGGCWAGSSAGWLPGPPAVSAAELSHCRPDAARLIVVMWLRLVVLVLCSERSVC